MFGIHTKTCPHPKNTRHSLPENAPTKITTSRPQYIIVFPKFIETEKVKSYEKAMKLIPIKRIREITRINNDIDLTSL